MILIVDTPFTSSCQLSLSKKERKEFTPSPLPPPPLTHTHTQAGRMRDRVCVEGGDAEAVWERCSLYVSNETTFHPHVSAFSEFKVVLV